MKILIIDGQGGRLGRQLAEMITSEMPGAEVTAVGTNSTDTASMLKGGAMHAATGENAVVVACRHADVIIGPIGIVIADSLLGEVTEKMAAAVARADAVRILIPVDRCGTLVAGVSDASTTELLNDAILKLKRLANDRNTVS